MKPRPFDVVGLSDWMRERLHPANRRVLAGEMTGWELVDRVNAEAFSGLPSVDDVPHDERWALIATTTMIASCAERHVQQDQRRVDPDAPLRYGEGLARLQAGREPFLRWLDDLAERLQHPRRDSFTTFIELNGRCAEVCCPRTGEPVYRIGSLFEDGRLNTFSGDPAEQAFINLLKPSVALQGAANEQLDPIHRGEVALDSGDALVRTLTAAAWMYAMRDLMNDFMRESGMRADFFLDIFRQYAVRWSIGPGGTPASASQDRCSLLRDVMIFDDLVPAREDFPGFHAHVRHYYPLILGPAAVRLEAAMGRPSLESRLREALGGDLGALAAAPEAEREALVRRSPWLAGYLELYRAQADNSRAHYASIMKYLYHPKRKRDELGDPRERVVVVPNDRGSSGLAPMGALRWLNTARTQHPLVLLGSGASVEAATREICEIAAPGALGRTASDLVRLSSTSHPWQKALRGKVWAREVAHAT